jgi:hypothetical protein
MMETVVKIAMPRRLKMYFQIDEVAADDDAT